MGSIADVRFGIKTGANEFFYVEDKTDIMKFEEIKNKIKNVKSFKSLQEIKDAGLRIVKNSKTDDYWLIESEFLKPVIKSPRESETIQINPNELKFRLIMCPKDRKDLEKSFLIQYIQWGEKEDFDKRPSTTNRNKWWDLGNRESCLFIVPCSFSDSFKVFENKNVLVDKRMYEGFCDSKKILVILNSFLFPLMMELGTRVGLGEGLLDVTVEEVQKIKIINPLLLREDIPLPKRKIGNVFEEAGIDPKRSIREQEPSPLEDRKILDDAVFDALDLTEEERKEVYWAVCELVKNRLEKAKSL